MEGYGPEDYRGLVEEFLGLREGGCVYSNGGTEIRLKTE